MEALLSENVQNCRYAGKDLDKGCLGSKCHFPSVLFQGGCLSTKEKRALLVEVPYFGGIRMTDWDNQHTAVGPYADLASASGQVGRVPDVHSEALG